MSARDLWTQGLDLRSNGQIAEACTLFKQAIAIADPEDLRLSEYHQTLGQVFDQLGDYDAGERELRKALDIELQRESDDSPSVAIARYFLGEHLLGVGRHADAVEVTAPSIVAGAKARAILHFVRARAFHALSDFVVAKSEARQALEVAGSAEQRRRLADQLENVMKA
jgi:tetratricopeptide (TPR) repeat protein